MNIYAIVIGVIALISPLPASALEFYYSFNGGEVNCNATAGGDECPTSAYSTGQLFPAIRTALNIDRSAKAGSKEFLLMANMWFEVDSNANGGSVNVEFSRNIPSGNATTTYNQPSTGSKSSMPFTVVATTTIGVETANLRLHTWASAENAGFDAADASIVALELPEGTQQISSEDESCSGSASTEQTKVTLAFTPGVTEDYLLIGHGLVRSEDWDDNGSPFFRMKINGAEVAEVDGNTTTGQDPLEFTNQSFYVTFMATSSLATGAERNISLHYEGDSSTDEACMSDARIWAIPLSAFDNVYGARHDAQVFAQTTNYTAVARTATSSIAAADYFVIYTTAIANEDPNQNSFSQFLTSTAALGENFTIQPGEANVSIEAPGVREFDEDDGDRWQITMGLGLSLSSGDASWHIRGRTDLAGGADDASFTYSRIVALQIPAEAEAPDTTPSRKIRLFEGYRLKFIDGRMILYQR